MRRTFLETPWAPLAVMAALAACSSPTSGDNTTPTVDVPETTDVPVTTDVPEAPDAPVADAPPADVPAAGCPAPTMLCSGLCVDTASDPRHCGACGNACPAGQVCAMGRCDVTCAAMTTNCSGVCRDLQNDARNCGMCGRACAAGQTCTAGECGTSCAAGTTDCSGVCRDLQNDNTHCGMCGNACPAGQSCVRGACTAVCGTGQTNCMGACRATSVDPDACGGCGTVCPSPMNATRYCASGVCGSACRAGFGDCDGNAMNGCEAALDTLDHCGGCGARCAFANAGAACMGGACRIGACNPGFADCNMNPQDGCETATQSDPSNCGACGRACAQGQVCTAGVCGASCPSGQTSCGGACTNTSFDPGHCGGCGRACPVVPNTLRACASGTCVPGVCTPGYSDCNRNLVDGCEVATGVDPLNCGSCGNVCNVANGTAMCRDGACAFGTCNAGFASCDGNDANGCETNLTNTAANCGACGNACGGGQVCMNSMCVMAGGFSTDWVLQMGTRGQYTRCASITASGSQVTCHNPEVRYGTVTGGVPFRHSGNNFTAWCQQLGFRSDVTVAYGTRNISAPQGRLFGCAEYDERVWHWCDWQDGYWYNQSLNSNSGGTDAITSITCSL